MTENHEKLCIFEKIQKSQDKIKRKTFLWPLDKEVGKDPFALIIAAKYYPLDNGPALQLKSNNTSI